MIPEAEQLPSCGAHDVAGVIVEHVVLALHVLTDRGVWYLQMFSEHMVQAGEQQGTIRGAGVHAFEDFVVGVNTSTAVRKETDGDGVATELHGRVVLRLYDES